MFNLNSILFYANSVIPHFWPSTVRLLVICSAGAESAGAEPADATLSHFPFTKAPAILSVRSQISIFQSIEKAKSICKIHLHLDTPGVTSSFERFKNRFRLI